MDLSEKELLAGAQRLDAAVLGAIYDRYQPKLYAYAMRLLGDECMAEDCVAETFLRFLKALQAGKGPRDYLQAYLYRIAHNWITDIYRRQPPPPLELDERLQDHHPTSYPEMQAEKSLLQKELQAALHRLTPDQRQVVMLRFFEGWNTEMVAAALQKPPGAVKALQHRALAALGKLLVKEEKEFENVPGTQDRPAAVEVV